MHNPYSKWKPPRKPKNFFSPVFGFALVDELALNLRSAKAFHRWLGKVIEWAEYKREKGK